MTSSLGRLIWTDAQRLKLFRSGDRLLLAVSGGADSMALLEIMHELASEHRLGLHVAHVHHMLRGSEADADRAFVRRYATRRGLPFVSAKADVPAYRRKHRLSPEEAAREVRYRFLERMRLTTGCDLIVTAHHADDQIETLLMRAMRGTGVRGLAGILPRLHVPPVVRPLLLVRQTELREYLAERTIPWRNDSSNEDVLLTRNRLRHRILPHLRTAHDPTLVESLPRLAVAAGKFTTHLDRTLSTMLGWVARTTGPYTIVPVEALGSLPRGVGDSMIGSLLSGAGVDVTTRRIDAVRSLLASRTGKRVMFRSAGRSFVREREHLSYGPIKLPEQKSLRLRAGGTVSLESATLRAGMPEPRPTTFPPEPSIAWVDAGAVKGPFVVRAWRAGDRFIPLGMNGRSKKVSDFLSDARVPLYKKRHVSVVTNRGMIVWVCGYRPDERFKVTPATTRAIQLSYHSYV